MKKIQNKISFSLLSSLLMALALTMSACDKDPTEDLQAIIKEDLGYVPKIATFRLLTPTPPAAPAVPAVQPGANLTLDLRYWSEGTIRDVQFFLIRGTTETKIGEQNYTPAFSRVTRTDSLIFNYQVPATIPRGSTFSIQARVANQGLEQYPTRAAVNFTVPQ